MESGVIEVYSAKHARQAYKNMKPFPRTNEIIQTIQLIDNTALTLDGSKR